MEETRRILRSKVYNILERIEQLDGSEEEVKHIDSAIKSLNYVWEEFKKINE